jgi:hypothetical protein
LALPRDWGLRDARVFATIPAGATITYLSGVAARQCEPDHTRCYKGRGEQLLFRDGDFHRTWFTHTECTVDAPAREALPAMFDEATCRS